MEKYTHKNLLIIKTETQWPIGYARDEESAQRLTDTLNATNSANEALWEKVEKLEKEKREKLNPNRNQQKHGQKSRRNFAI